MIMFRLRFARCSGRMRRLSLNGSSLRFLAIPGHGIFHGIDQIANINLLKSREFNYLLIIDWE